MYRSKLEKKLGEGKLKHLQYEPFRLAYTQEKEYLPDFVNQSKNILFEAKGIFRDAAEARKYVDIQASNPEWEIIFIFSDPDKPLIWSRKRVTDGKRMTHGDWAAKHGFKYCTEFTIKKEWL
jgi:hypothetical protein